MFIFLSDILILVLLHVSVKKYHPRKNHIKKVTKKNQLFKLNTFYLISYIYLFSIFVVINKIPVTCNVWKSLIYACHFKSLKKDVYPDFFLFKLISSLED